MINMDSYLNLDLTKADLPFKSADDFVLNSDFHHLVVSGTITRTSKIIDQSIAFFKAFYSILLQHKIIKSDFIRGLSCFDSAKILHGGEDRYVPAVEQLTSYFASHGSITACDKTETISQYRALVVKFRSSQVDRTIDWFNSFLATANYTVDQNIRCSTTLPSVSHQWRKCLFVLWYPFLNSALLKKCFSPA